MHGDTPLAAHGLFIAFVAIAVYAQTVTGFALSLVLLSLVGITGVAPLPDTINALAVIVVLNAAMFLWRRRPVRVERAIRPAVAASLVGAVLGMAVLQFLADNAMHLLRMLLGACVIGCAGLLWRSVDPRATPSRPRTFAWVGALSGVLGGLFSASGPPLVYLVYRQPWPLARMQESLIFAFAAGAALRLVAMGVSGHFSRGAAQLAAEAVPVVLLVTFLAANRRPPVSPARLRQIVCVLLVGAGVGLLL